VIAGAVGGQGNGQSDPPHYGNPYSGNAYGNGNGNGNGYGAGPGRSCPRGR
jgi:hypothetical protein